ncbi:MAG: N-acetyl sugar amidotransferase, partial [Patescibacteria group bacterium]
CFNYSDLHDYIKFLKWGYGKVTDHASREIRLKRLTREEGIDLVKKYQNLPSTPERLKLFLDWIDMSEKEFFKYIDARRDQRIWQKDSGTWKLLDSVTNHVNDDGVEATRLKPARHSLGAGGKKENCKFIITPSKEPEYKENKYILIGRGWRD